MTVTLYEKYGGFAQINRVVIRFYDELLDNDVLGAYFDDVDLPRLIDHQTKFIASLLGGPVSFDDEALRRAHKRLGITHEELDLMKSILAGVFREASIADEDIKLVLAELERRRPLIVVT